MVSPRSHRRCLFGNFPPQTRAEGISVPGMTSGDECKAQARCSPIFPMVGSVLQVCCENAVFYSNYEPMVKTNDCFPFENRTKSRVVIGSVPNLDWQGIEFDSGVSPAVKAIREWNGCSSNE
ncbi:MAG: hypothetical protein CM15mP71_1690 [Candidatus Poseidoniales archaeon]|nr:MAG: hypothetical protein CM15mP71_1690 [Candidatus Poseidoniales archaeon]